MEVSAMTTHEAAGGTYVEISREEFEDWLNKTGYKWERDRSKAGIYVVKLSPNVGIHISSSIGSRDTGLARGRASVKMKLVSLITGYTLNKKVQGRDHFKRTKGWRQTWKKGLDDFKGAYMKAKDWYDKLATIESRDEYKDEWLGKIEEIGGWETDRMLKDFHDKLEKGSVLSDKQEAAIERTKGRGAGPGRAPQEAPNEELLAKLRELWKRAKAAADRGDRDGEWTMGFAQNMGEKLKKGWRLTPNEKRKIDEKLKRYRVASMLAEGAIQRVASQFLARSL